MEKGEVQVVTEDGKRPSVIQNELTVSQAESYGRLAQEKESLLKQLEDLKLEGAHEKSQNLIARHEQNHQVLGVLNTELSCVICSEIIIEAVTIECGHIFCSHCISTWFSQQKSSRSCPTCRTPTFKDPIKISRLNSTIASFHALLSEEVQSDRRQLLEVRNKAEQKMADARSQSHLRTQNYGLTSESRTRAYIDLSDGRWFRRHNPGMNASNEVSLRLGERLTVRAPAYPRATLPSASQTDHNPDQPVILHRESGDPTRPTTTPLSSRSNQGQATRHIHQARRPSRIN